MSDSLRSSTNQQCLEIVLFIIIIYISILIEYFFFDSMDKYKTYFD